jgi:hypothetical protein
VITSSDAHLLLANRGAHHFFPISAKHTIPMNQITIF